MNYFKYYPEIPYVFQSNGNYTLTITNISLYVLLVQAVQKNVTIFYPYKIQEGERPDTVSMNVYGVPDYTWIILIVNQIFTLFDWPLTSDEFTNYIIEKYGSVAAAQTSYIYQTNDGYQVDFATWSALTAQQQLPPIDNYDYELDLNEVKRNIQIIPPQFIGSLDTALKAALAG